MCICINYLEIKDQIISIILTCSRHRTLQNNRIPILQIFVLVYGRGTRKNLYWSKSFFGPMKTFSCPPSINKNKDLENYVVGMSIEKM